VPLYRNRMRFSSGIDSPSTEQTVSGNRHRDSDFADSATAQIGASVTRVFPPRLARLAEICFFAPPGISSYSSWGDHPGVVLTPRPSLVDQDPQHRELLDVDHRTQAGIGVPTSPERASVAAILRH
jgi:hypothetical protein